MQIKFDRTGLDDLAGMLERAAARPHKERAAALDRTARRVADDARANAAAFHTKSTGELARSIEVSGTPVSRRVEGTVRQAFFLEFGSPNTGPPRPWLTEPAQRGANELFDELGRIGQIW